MCIWALLTNHWQVLHQYQNGMIDKAVLDAYIARLQVTLSMSISCAMCRSRIKDRFPADFQEHVQQHIESDA